MNQCGRDVGFLNRRMNILGTTAANAVDEVCVMVTRTLAVWPGFGLICQPGLVCIVSIDAEIGPKDGLSAGFLVGSAVSPAAGTPLVP